MDIEDVRGRVARLRDEALDEEHAHMAEDEMYHDVLLAIAQGEVNPAGLAAEALEARTIEFDRWYA